jgi:hypothetical protein
MHLPNHTMDRTCRIRARNCNQWVTRYESSLLNYKIVHLEGSPQGPSLSFSNSTTPLTFVFGCGEPFAFSAFALSFPPLPCETVTTFLVPSSQKLTLLMAVPKDSP